MSRHIFALLFAAAVAAALRAQQIDVHVVGSTHALPPAGGSGEVQSTVVPPDAGGPCAAGRILFTLDKRMTPNGPQSGTVVWRDLDNLDDGALPKTSSFCPDPDVNAANAVLSTDAFLTADDDIRTYDNRDVVLLWGYHTRAALDPAPAWFSDAWKTNKSDGTKDWGPGSRRGTIVYRSRDCGGTFQIVSKVDPANIDPKHPASTDCGLPAAAPAPNGTTHHTNGGSDGQLARILPDGNLYLTMQCTAWSTPQPGKTPDYTKDREGRTYVLRSKDEGSHWTTLGYLSKAVWRQDVAYLPNGDLAFSTGKGFAFAHFKNGAFDFSTPAQPAASDGTAGWGTEAETKANVLALNHIMGSAIAGHLGDGKTNFLAFKARFADSSGNQHYGYRLFLYDQAAGAFGELPPILPASEPASGKRSITMHLTAIDVGDGPVMLYWDDVDAATATVTIRGRLLVRDGSTSPDFVVASDGAASHTFPATAGVWYGDYRTAAGYASKDSFEYHYFPIWVESDQRVHFSHVSATLKPGITKAKFYLAPKWKKAPPLVELRQFLGAEELVTDEESATRD